jgi:hypothetical protein
MTAAAGENMTVKDMIAAQTKIERQDASHTSAVSFDRHAANAFQSYVHAALAFSIKVWHPPPLRDHLQGEICRFNRVTVQYTLPGNTLAFGMQTGVLLDHQTAL